MASNEKQFKTEFVQAARAQGAHVVVIAGAYLAGIPDLYIKFPDESGFWLELKYQEGPKKGYPVTLTALQRAFLAKTRAVHGWGAWLLCVNVGGDWNLYGSSTELPHQINADGPWLIATRMRGQKWDPHTIIRRLTYDG